MTRDVFISHAGEDANVAVEVCALLEKRGLKCWMAPRDVAAGSVWDEAILDAIETSRVFLLILSKSANDSQYVKNEVNCAFSERKPIVTFRIEDVIPGRSLQLYLARHHWTDAFPPPMGARVETLATSITALLDMPAPAAAAPAAAAPAAPPPRPTLGARLLFSLLVLTKDIRALGRLGLIVSVITLFLGAAIASLFIWKLRPAALQPVDRPLVRLDVDLGPDVSLGSPQGTDTILSSDGTRLAYVSRGRLYTRRLDQQNETELVGAQGGYEPFFSPDGKWVAFFAVGGLKKISVESGSVVALCNANNGKGGSWGEDGNIIAALRTGGGLSHIPSGGGPPTAVTDLQSGEATHRWPQILPGGKAVLFTASPTVSAFDGANIEVMSLEDHHTKTLVQGGMFGRYLPSGYLVYMNRGTLFAVPFDLERLEVHGTPAPVLDQVGYNAAQGSAQFDFSQAGTLVYHSGGTGGGLLTVAWLDGAGKTQPLLAKPGNYQRPSMSPDGQRLALEVTEGPYTDIWLYDRQRDTMTRLTFTGNANAPVWSPDGRYIAFEVLGEGMSVTRSDGSGNPRALTQSKNIQVPWSFTPDGKQLAFYEQDSKTLFDLWTVPLESDSAGLRAGKPEVFLKTTADERTPTFSPDGRWLAYISDESGSFQVYVRAFPDKGGKWQISNGGGWLPMWSHNGHDLFFEALDNHIMMAAFTAKGDSFVADKPRLWSEKQIGGLTLTSRNFDLSADGKLIVALMPAETAEGQKAQNHLIFLENFFDEVRRRTAVGTK
jgi:serine/threonine-protein kinase